MDATTPHLGAPEGTYPELLKLAGPNVVSRLGVMAMGVTDAIVVGHHSAEQLGFHSLGWAPTGTVLVAGLGLLMGIQVMTARHRGAGRPELTGPGLRRGLSYALLIGVLSTALLMLGGPLVLSHMGLEPRVAAGATPVLLIFSLSITPYLLADALWLWLEGQERPHVPMVAMWIANGLNLALALWLVPGNSPFPVSGALAAAWVTFFARVSLMLMLGIWVWRWPRAHALGVFRAAPRDPAAAREQRRIGYATGVSFAIEGGAFSGISFIAAQLGVMAVAAWAVVVNVAALVFMVPLGIAAATGVLVARSVGARSVAGVRRAFRMGMTVAMVLLAALSLIVLLDSALVVRIYTSDEALAMLAGPALFVACFFFMADGAQVVSAQALRARGDIWWPTGMHAISYIVVMLPLSWWLGVHRGGGLTGIVWGVAIASIISGVALWWRFVALKDRMKQGDI